MQDYAPNCCVQLCPKALKNSEMTGTLLHEGKKHLTKFTWSDFLLSLNTWEVTGSLKQRGIITV